MFKEQDPLFQFEGELTRMDLDYPVHKLPTLYDRGDLEHRKKWATNVNQRDYVSTRTAHFAKQYGHAVAMGLEASSQSDRRTWRSLVRQYGLWLQGYYQMSSEPLTEPLRQLMQNIQYALARSFVARWRQYLPMFQEEFDELAKKFQVHADQTKQLTRYWTKLWRHIEYERIDWHGRSRSRYPFNWVPQTFSSAVSTACKTLGVHDDRVFEMVEHYGTTSSTKSFHTDIEETLVKGGYHTIFAEILYRDLTELDNFLDFTDTSISETDADIIKGTLRMVIEKHIEMLYTIREPSHDKPQEWSLTATGGG
ncbi:hypothetical protein LTS07_006007 [Exophiala sideris]|uniref:Uncharacterized protein n=1 Tax=Exophiala sideris TaxID=1016849 RepID=A0ABR0J841_9EURO|nr:hypothetical protein LTS07_006007 [Exophiala sideris]KAK5036761.1 hypothetical protein LTR13_005141 [Exophiala sideris]KAK5058173.1 hypothetical protein LTR69_007171 [Exophiala sideris]KAK5182133.1 hypothetical protein LTR44_005734 [Eurotiomycetes sp. CCFEE 6388]